MAIHEYDLMDVKQLSYYINNFVYLRARMYGILKNTCDYRSFLEITYKNIFGFV